MSRYSADHSRFFDAAWDGSRFARRGAISGRRIHLRQLQSRQICAVNSAFAATWIKQNLGKEVIFSLSTRDMNRVAAQGLLLGANMMGLENVVVLKGDSFTAKELTITKPVDDYAPTSLISAIADMNRGVDYKGLKLSNPTNFCIGATIDLGVIWSDRSH